MSIISPNAFGNSLSFGADSRQILTKFRTENGDSHTSLTYNLGVPCNEDSDCPMGNLCMDSQCYYKCNNTSVNDCPFWHTCRSDIHPSESVCGPHTLSSSKATLPTKRITPTTGSQPIPAESEGFFTAIYRKLFG
jgi:hypothetical protein